MVEVGAGPVRPAVVALQVRAVEAGWAGAEEGASIGVGGGARRSRRRRVGMGPTDVELRWDPSMLAAARCATGFSDSSFSSSVDYQSLASLPARQGLFLGNYIMLLEG